MALRGCRSRCAPLQTRFVSRSYARRASTAATTVHTATTTHPLVPQPAPPMPDAVRLDEPVRRQRFGDLVHGTARYGEPDAAEQCEAAQSSHRSRARRSRPSSRCPSRIPSAANGASPSRINAVIAHPVAGSRDERPSVASGHVEKRDRDEGHHVGRQHLDPEVRARRERRQAELPVPADGRSAAMRAPEPRTAFIVPKAARPTMK